MKKEHRHWGVESYISWGKSKGSEIEQARSFLGSLEKETIRSQKQQKGKIIGQLLMDTVTYDQA